MNVRRTQCRTCLKTPATKAISQLEEVLNADNKNCNDIMMFCLDITVTSDSNITTNLCYHCYRKIVAFYKFKALSIKNDDYWKSVYVDGNGIKLESSLDPDEFGPSIVEDYPYVAQELDVKYEDTEDRDDKELQSLEKENEFGEIKDEPKETGDQQNNDHPYAAPVPKKRERSKTLKLAIAPMLKKRKRSKKLKLSMGKKTCEECGKSVHSLTAHLTAHRLKGELKMIQCKFCPKLFATANGLKRHHKIKHLGLKKECDICHKQYVNLLAHKLRVHAPHAPRFACVFCERQFVSQFALHVHLATHKKRHYECDVCHRKFPTRYQIKCHIQRVHEKIKRYQCHVCPKGFYLKFQFEDHFLRTHSTERPYKCEECGKFYATVYCLRKHRGFIHGAHRTFHCQLCDKSYPYESSLRKHVRSHTKEKNYACQFCGERFAHSHHRSRHVARHHKQLVKPSDWRDAVAQHADVESNHANSFKQI